MRGSNQELLASVIRGKDANRIAKDLLDTSEGSFKRLERIIDDVEVEGLGKRKRASVKSALQMGRRYRMQIAERVEKIGQPADLARAITPMFEQKQQEELWIFLLNTKNQIQDKRMIYRGTLDASIVHPRDIFRYAIKKSASKIMLAHNHPSGNPEPSQKDILTTQQLVEVGSTVQIPVLDHVVIGDSSFVSFQERDLL